MSTPNAEELAASMSAPPVASSLQAPDATQLLFDAEEPPPFPEMNIFPLEWRVETPKLQQIYDASRVPGWSPHTLPWDTLDPEAFTLDQRYALAYWFTLLSVFDGSGPAVFSRAFIHTWETHEEDPIRKCFFSIVRDEVNHEEVCQRAIQTLTPNGPLDYEPETPLGLLARNNIKWYYHNGCRYWNGFKNGVTKFQLPILFSSFLMGEVASATLFHSMYERTTIPAFKEAFKQVGKDEARHMAVCLAVLRNALPQLTDEQRQIITKQIRAGFVFLFRHPVRAARGFLGTRPDISAGAPHAGSRGPRGRPRHLDGRGASRKLAHRRAAPQGRPRAPRGGVSGPAGSRHRRQDRGV